jgi:hypothetical protein
VPQGNSVTQQAGRDDTELDDGVRFLVEQSDTSDELINCLLTMQSTLELWICL